MLYIPQFAREIKLDSISFHKLRIEKYSPLKDIVEQTPGYYYERIGGPVYSDQYGLKELKQIRNKIRHRFYNTAQILHIIRKANRLGIVSTRDLGHILFHLPRIVYKMAQEKRHKKRR